MRFQKGLMTSLIALQLLGCGDDDKKPETYQYELTLQGQSSLMNATVSTSLSEKEYQANTSLEGKFEIKLQANKDEVVLLNILPTSDKAPEMAILGSISQLIEWAGNDAILTKEELPSLHLSPFSTAKAIMIKQSNGGEIPANADDLARLEQQLSVSYWTASAAMLAEYNEGQWTLPSGYESIIALLENPVDANSHVKAVKESRHPYAIKEDGIFNETLERLNQSLKGYPASDLQSIATEFHIGSGYRSAPTKLNYERLEFNGDSARFSFIQQGNYFETTLLTPKDDNPRAFSLAEAYRFRYFYYTLAEIEALTPDATFPAQDIEGCPDKLAVQAREVGYSYEIIDHGQNATLIHETRTYAFNVPKCDGQELYDEKVEISMDDYKIAFVTRPLNEVDMSEIVGSSWKVPVVRNLEGHINQTAEPVSQSQIDLRYGTLHFSDATTGTINVEDISRPFSWSIDENQLIRVDFSDSVNATYRFLEQDGIYFAELMLNVNGVSHTLTAETAELTITNDTAQNILSNSDNDFWQHNSSLNNADCWLGDTFYEDCYSGWQFEDTNVNLILLNYDPDDGVYNQIDDYGRLIVSQNKLVTDWLASTAPCSRYFIDPVSNNEISYDKDLYPEVNYDDTYEKCRTIGRTIELLQYNDDKIVVSYDIYFASTIDGELTEKSLVSTSIRHFTRMEIPKFTILTESQQPAEKAQNMNNKLKKIRLSEFELSLAGDKNGQTKQSTDRFLSRMINHF